MSEETTLLDTTVQPYSDLNDRKVPIQGKCAVIILADPVELINFNFWADENYRGLLLTIYISFLIIGLPVWWYCTDIPAISIPSKYLKGIEYHLSKKSGEIESPDTIYSSYVSIFLLRVVLRSF